jgi:uncharacterized protein (TIGR02246 family)
VPAGALAARYAIRIEKESSMKSIYLVAAVAVAATAAWAGDTQSNTNTNSTSTPTKNLGSTEGSTSKSDLGTNDVNQKEVSQKDLSAIKDVAQNLATAFNDADAKAGADLFAQDAVVINPAGQRASGRDAVQQLLRSDLNGFLKGTTTTFTNIQVKMLKPDVAFFDMEQELSGGKFTNGNEAPKIHVTGVAVKRGASWLIEEARPATYLKEQPTT